MSDSTKENIVADLFKTMNDSPATFSHSNLAKHWLKAHDNYFAGYENGNYIPKSQAPTHNQVEITFAKDFFATVKIAITSELEAAANTTAEGFQTWQQFDAEAKSKVLYRIAQSIEQQSKLFNAVENLSPYGRLREKQNVPYLVHSFNYCAGLVGDKELSKGWKPPGVVCVIAEDACRPTTVSILWQVSSILAAGNAILFLVNCNTYLSAFLLAETCHSAGLPSGVFNVLPCDKSSFTPLPKVDKVILTSSDFKQVTAITSGMNLPCEFNLPTWPTAIIYESADLDAAIAGILEMLIIIDDEKARPACVINIQESIFKKFITLLAKKVCQTIGENAKTEKSLFYIMGSEVITAQLQELLSTCNSEIKSVNLCSSVFSENDKQTTPAILMNFASDSEQKHNEIRYGPGIYIEPFRTVKESIAMFNNNKRAPDVSIWTEEMHLALEVVHKLKTRSVWINSQNLYEPSVAHGSVYLSGNSVFGGKEGFFNQLSIFERDTNKSKSDNSSEIQSYGSEAPSSITLVGSQEEKEIKRNMKLYIGGSFTNSQDETVQLFSDAKNEPYAYIASAKKSDINKAVSSASASQPKWESLSKTKRSAILRKASDLLSKKKEEFISELCCVTGLTKEFCSKEVELTIKMLFFWANYITHFDDHAMETKLYGKVLQEHHPLGVIGIQCPDKEPLLSFVFLVTPAVIFGNATVAITSEKYPTCAIKMCEVFQAAGLPGGVLNVVAGSRPYLTRQLCSHLSIDSIWFSMDGDNFIYNSSYTVQPKRVFNCKDMANNLDEAKKFKFAFESTYSKAIYMPMGTGFV